MVHLLLNPNEVCARRPRQEAARGRCEKQATREEENTGTEQRPARSLPHWAWSGRLQPQAATPKLGTEREV